MNNKRWTNMSAGILALLVSVMVVTITLAGGFYLSVEQPGASSNPVIKNAALIVRPTGCHEPQKAVMTASAEGLVNGRRQSITLKLHPVEAGVYAIHRQWPSEGTWMVAVTGKYLEATRSALVALNTDGSVRMVKGENGRSNILVNAKHDVLTRKVMDSALAQFAKENKRDATLAGRSR